MLGALRAHHRPRRALASTGPKDAHYHARCTPSAPSGRESAAPFQSEGGSHGAAEADELLYGAASARDDSVAGVGVVPKARTG